ncbi:hypothetical protein FRC11_007634 [Ceratobasidium sp. 423]|nr:hypothetical protein FRC11_007634 [Ceratobasidium sp. 423]
MAIASRPVVQSPEPSPVWGAAAVVSHQRASNVQGFRPQFGRLNANGNTYVDARAHRGKCQAVVQASPL